ncbi:MAG: cytochrome c oxidase assembly protein [Boseongicola sp. SB0677_bin_26]|nr:cytochrome c oxidase assembly protein [Boseongicola sp. SB0665_bin_10]MYG25332.1 cytochrome c oxidase assembly protein [Boseongicola sp. SB0677_bin_26]
MMMDARQRTAARLAGVALVMGSLAWASVPLYDLFCRVTGWGGTTDVAESPLEEPLEEMVTVRFDASTASGMPWEFKPEQIKLPIRIGEEGLAFYEAFNPTSRTIAGTASFNVAPFSAGAYFSKIDCFCFELQVLEPGQRVSMPVSFFIEPAILDDPDARFVKTITLSYTFHDVDLPEDYRSDQAALGEGGTAAQLN